MIANQALQTFLRETAIPLRLACTAPSGWPLVLSLWYLYRDNCLYCATPQSAKVVRYLRADPRCGYEIAGDEPPYCGVRGRAIVTIEPDNGDAILEQLLHRYVGGTDNRLGRKLLARKGPEVALRLELHSAYTWNFSKRMVGSGTSAVAKICPEAGR